MAHAQQQVLDAIKAALIGNTAAGTHVYVDQTDPLQPNQLPAVLIGEAEAGEQVVTEHLDGHQQRSLDVVLACVVAGGATTAADARELGLEVEKVLNANAALLTQFQNFGFRILQSRQINNGDADRAMAGRMQGWRFGYMVAPGAPDVILT